MDKVYRGNFFNFFFVSVFPRISMILSVLSVVDQISVIFIISNLIEISTKCFGVGKFSHEILRKTQPRLVFHEKFSIIFDRRILILSIIVLKFDL